MTGSDCVQDEKTSWKKVENPLPIRPMVVDVASRYVAMISRMYIQVPSSALAVLRILQPGTFRFVDPWVSSTPE